MDQWTPASLVLKIAMLSLPLQLTFAEAVLTFASNTVQWPLKPETILWEEANMPTAGTCALKCSHDKRCRTFFFNVTTDTCSAVGREDDVTTGIPNQRLFLLRIGHVTCPLDKGYVYSSVLALCLKVHVTRAKYDAARATCQSEGEDLVIIRSWEEETFVRNVISAVPESDRFFGGARKNASGQLEWVDGTPVTQMFLSPSGNQFQHKALVLFSTGWSSGFLYVKRPFICQKKLT